MMEWLVPLSVFLLLTVLIVVVYYRMAPQPGHVAERRLEELGRHITTSVAKVDSPPPAAPRSPGVVPDLLNRVGRFFWPASKASQSLRRKLRRAGYYGENAVLMYTGARVLAAVLLPILAIVGLSVMEISVQFVLFVPLLAMAVGVWLPSLSLGMRTSKRKVLIRNELPDALDLMVACVEAGLGLNAALVRTSQELKIVHPELAQEIEIANLEIRAGTPREEALRNLGERTQVKDLKSFAAMLIQTDRFGVSIAQSLRVFSDTLRTKRRQRAEKAAAETTIKLVFPLVFFIFPVMFIVLLGPAVIQIGKALGQE